MKQKFWKIFLTTISIFCMILSISILIFTILHWQQNFTFYSNEFYTNHFKENPQEWARVIYNCISDISQYILYFIFSFLLFLFVNLKDLQFLTAPIIESFMEYKRELKIKRKEKQKEKMEKDIQRKQAQLKEWKNENDGQ